MKKLILILAATVAAACTTGVKIPGEVTMEKKVLQDKIRGAWAGQIIGCTYGGPTEFQHPFMMDDDEYIPWEEHYIRKWFDKSPGLYDDVYMDLTFVGVFDKLGLDAPVDAFAQAFANAEYPLWHANAQGRYNILHGINPPASGHWTNNPHADDIDFQIESDYAGIMSPGMPNSAAHYCDGIGHMMNSGDGYYGGVYMASLYSLAMVCDDMQTVVKAALGTIPAGSLYGRAMADVIAWCAQYPDDWKQTWFLVNKKYGSEKGCPDGVHTGFNIDALMNSAYVVIGLLYGEKDFYKTIDIATRCGQDSDCNPASAGGILGAMLGYEAIPRYWKAPLEEVADRNFPYTGISFNKAGELSTAQALEVIERGGGSVEGDKVTIKVQTPEPVALEQNFEGHVPYDIIFVRDVLSNVDSICFYGNGVVVRYNFLKNDNADHRDYVAEVDAYLDGQLSEKLLLPSEGNGYSPEFYYKYNLPVGNHKLTFDWTNRIDGVDLRLSRVVIYSDKPKAANHQ